MQNDERALYVHNKNNKQMRNKEKKNKSTNHPKE